MTSDQVELHRRQCEARHYARMPGAERVACLERIAKKRGREAANQLADDIRALKKELEHGHRHRIA